MNGLKWATIIVAGLVASLALTILCLGLPVGESMRLIVDGAFGDRFGISRTLVKATPLLLTGLGIVVAWRAGMYNIGGEGQFLIGGLCAAATYKWMGGLPSGLLMTLMVVSSIVGGAAYAWIAGWLYVRQGAQIVISTILLNFIAIQLLGWSVSGPLREASGRIPQTETLDRSLMFFRFDRQTDLHLGLLFAPLAALAVAVFMYWTPQGFKLRFVGENWQAARAARFDSSAIQLWAMAISGALCGLAASCDYMGVTGAIDAGFSQQWGFLGIPVALLGGLSSIGTIASAIYFGALLAGSDQLGRFTASGPTIVYIVQGVAVLAFIGIRARAEAGLKERTP